ncbi:transcription factor pcc1 domain-containing protein [Phthorimaea operculella]|nr:transcription factor pcc1 domain-containing protein [Phthorimaea operculella]
MAKVTENSEKNICITIPFDSDATACLAQEVLAVDKELKGSKIRRVFTTDKSNLVINFYGTEIKMLRVAVNSVLKNILLIVKTIDQFS